MKRSFEIIGALVFFLAISLLCSFALLDTFENPDPVLPKAAEWVNDNKILSALIVSEAAGMLSAKIRGIIQGVWVGLKWLFSFFNNNRAKAHKK